MARSKLSKAGISILVYAVYLGSGGLAFAFVPDLMLRIFGLPPTHEVWIRLFGFLALVLAVKGAHGALQNLSSSMQLDVITRTCFATFLTALVVLGLSPRILLLFAVIDFLASVWTQVALWAERRGGAPRQPGLTDSGARQAGARS